MASALVQSQPPDVAGRPDENWTELVVTLKDGNKYSFKRSTIAKLAYVGGTSADATAVLTSGKSFNCELLLEGASRPFFCTIQITTYKAADGTIDGDLTWLFTGALHRIHGSLIGNHLNFTARPAKGRSTDAGTTYTLTLSASGAEGPFSDATEKTRGTMTIKLP